MNTALTASSEAESYAAAPRRLTSGFADKRRLRESMRVTMIDDWRELERYVIDWEDLANNAIERNVFYESWMLLPALRTVCASKETRFALVFSDDTAAPQLSSKLCGFFPLEMRDRYRGLPFRTSSLLAHQHCFLNTPLIRRENADLTISKFIDWVDADAGCRLFQWRRIRGDGPFSRMLEAALDIRNCPTFYEEDYTRAFFQIDGDAEEYVPPFLSGRGRRELKRRRQRLAEAGELRYCETEAFDNVEWWIDSFLRLEASGWKGQQGTALACDVSGRAFFAETCRAAFASGRLFMSALLMGNRPVAMQCSYVAGDGCFAFKCAFDETYNHYSPGTLLLADTVMRLSRRRGLYWMDSCTDPDNDVANRLCSDRRRILTVTMSTGRVCTKQIAASALIQALPSMRLVKHHLFKRTRKPR